MSPYPTEPRTDVVRAFLEGAEAAVEAAQDPTLRQRWDSPSSLALMSVGTLTAHLTRAVTTVQTYLESAPPPPTVGSDGATTLPISAGEYFGTALAASALFALDSPLNKAIRDRSETTAAGGPHEVASAVRTAWQNLSERLPRTSSDRELIVFDGRRMLLGEYLRTRCVELAVHLDDLGRTAPERTATVAAQALFDATLARHSDLAVVRALARGDRADPGVLRVF